VIIVDTRSSKAAAKFAAAFGCVFDFDSDYCSPSEQLSGGAASTPLNVARKRLSKA
jgi:hypothetical protein